MLVKMVLVLTTQQYWLCEWIMMTSGVEMSASPAVRVKSFSLYSAEFEKSSPWITKTQKSTAMSHSGGFLLRPAVEVTGDCPTPFFSSFIHDIWEVLFEIRSPPSVCVGIFMSPSEDTLLWHISVSLNISLTSKTRAVSHRVLCLLLVFVLHGFPRPVAESEPGGKLRRCNIFCDFTLHLAVQLTAR